VMYLIFFVQCGVTQKKTARLNEEMQHLKVSLCQVYYLGGGI
jgi:hypothetical protein